VWIVKEPGISPPALLPSDERALVIGCRDGDPASLDRFFRTYFAYVARVIGRLIGSTPDLQDLVHATFIEAIGSFDRYRGGASLKTWVTRIAVHLSLNELRAGVRRHVPLELVPPSIEPRDASSAADVQLSVHQLGQQLHALLDKLGPKKRVAFLLFTIEEYSIDEVAALTGASRAATKSRIWFARRELLAAVKNRPELRQFVQSAVGGESWR
jgi:RNA polymerase sigma-70 factor (ECF subfamily)